jgi:hypothetical protein
MSGSFAMCAGPKTTAATSMATPDRIAQQADPEAPPEDQFLEQGRANKNLALNGAVSI